MAQSVYSLGLRAMHISLNLKTLNTRPQTLNPKSKTLSSKHKTLNPDLWPGEARVGDQ